MSSLLQLLLVHVLMLLEASNVTHSFDAASHMKADSGEWHVFQSFFSVLKIPLSINEPASHGFQPTKQPTLPVILWDSFQAQPHLKYPQKFLNICKSMSVK